MCSDILIKTEQISNSIGYVFFATAWSSVHGGINSFNYDLCRAISVVGAQIHVVLPSDAELPQDDQVGIKFVRVPEIYEKFGSSSIAKLRSDILTAQNIFWLGHDSVTGGVAQIAAKLIGGKSVVFHHMDYSNYYYLKSNDGAKKIALQKALIKQADIALCVGPRLLGDAKHIRPLHQETYEIIPGVPETKVGDGRVLPNFRISLCGRLSVSEDKVKNINAGIKAAVRFLSDLPEKNGSLTLIGIESTEISRFSVQDRSVAINLVPYVKDREEYFLELSGSDLVVMPSVKEGFGLVAWEALSLGIPVVISKSSGLYEYLKGLDLERFVCAVDITGLPTMDEGVIFSTIKSCFTEYESVKACAQELSKTLKKNTWPVVAKRFLDLVSPEVPIRNATVKDFSPEVLGPGKAVKPKVLHLERDLSGGSFDRFEDLLALTVKKREIVFSRGESTDYSRGQRIKFEYWCTWNPMRAFYLYLPPLVNLKQTIARFFELLAKYGNAMPSQIFVLRRDKGDATYLKKIFSEKGHDIDLCEYSLKEFVWEYCIDSEFKVGDDSSAPVNYVDQEVIDEVTKLVESSARELLISRLSERPECSAHLVIAPGGMGKTWLCRSVAAELGVRNKDSQLVVLISAEDLREYIREVGSAYVQVNTIFDLYELYSRAQQVGQRKYDRSTFELSILTGNIVLIVDGLDELVAVLQERFDLARFLSSVVEMRTGLLSSHVLLTTRDGLLVDNVTSEINEIKRYELLGFTDRDWTKYANRRFHGAPRKQQIVDKLRSTLSESLLSSGDGRVIPFFVDVLCNIFEEDLNENAGTPFSLDDDPIPYCSNNEVIDRIVYSVFRREVRRQSIDLDIANLVGFLAEVVSEHGKEFSASALQTNLELYFDARADDLATKIRRNPLLVVDNGLVKLKYDFLQSYFRSLFLIECLRGALSSPEAIGAYAKCNSAEGPEIQYLKKYYSGAVDALENIVAELVPKLRTLTRSGEDIKRAELARRAMSGVWKIYRAVRQFNGAKLTEKMFEILSGSFPGRSIDGLALYGEFPALDFSDATVQNSKFMDFGNFGKSKLSGATFISCVFERCGGVITPGGTVHLANFENSCVLGDVADMVAQSESLSSAEGKIVEAECLSFLRSFFWAGGSYDPKRSWIKFSTKVRGLRQKDFEKLIPKFIVVKTKKADETYYSVAADFAVSARDFFDNNFVDSRMREFIEFVK